ncbi:ABC transporter substrate-binding protein [Desulfosarcina ovata]|nr:ABC transporter substrate binding protein [Desulfosarcina ovata]
MNETTQSVAEAVSANSTVQRPAHGKMQWHVWPAILLILIGCLGALPAAAAESNPFSTKPTTHHGLKWRIGYLEGGPYSNYPLNLKALVAALADLGWVETVDSIPLGSEADTSLLWRWISRNIKSDYLTFVADAYWSSNWDGKKRRIQNRRAVIKRLTTKKDIDLMLAMGTWAGQDLATNRHHVPTIVISSSNPVGAKIIKSEQDSGFDHVNARVDPTRYERQLRIFHDIVGFTRLGIVSESDTVEGKTYAAINDVQRVAGEKHFDILSCHAPFSKVTQEEAFQAVLRCHRQLAPKVDAFYITVHRGVDLQRMPELLAPFYEYKVPTFSQSGSQEVQAGVLLSIARAGFKYIAEFHAQTIAKIFNGAKPHDLDQLFQDPPRIAINTRTARIIGYDPPMEILNMADEIY